MSQMPPPGVPPTGPVSYQTPPPGAQASQGMAIGSLVCGIGSIVLFCIWIVSIPLGIVAIVLGQIAKGKIARGEAGGATLAKTGVILGAIGIALSVLIQILAIVGITVLGNKAKEFEERERLRQQQQGTTQQQLVIPVPVSSI